MQEKWNFSSTFLPYAGEPIDFKVEDRSQPIRGTFANGAFHSRWADYDARRVTSWREASDPAPALQIASPKFATPGWFDRTWKLLASLLRRCDRIVHGRRHTVIHR